MSDPAPAVLKQKLLLIGWDSADWRLLRPLMAEGKMPHLQALAARGISGSLGTLQPMLSPMLWTSIATGKRAFKHGILGFVEPEPATGGVRPVSSLSRKTKAVWNILCQAGLRCHVVGWWPSHPVEPIRGVMVSNHFQQATAMPDDPWPVRPGSVHPERLIEHLAPLRLHPMDVDGNTLLPFVPKAAQVNQEKDQRLFSIAKVVAENAGIHAAATGILQLEPWDFMAIYYDGLDHFGHLAMKYHPPRRPDVKEEDFDLYSGVMEAAARFHDMMLGVLLELAGPDTRVMLISDHGFHPDHLRPDSLPNEPAGPAAEHRAYGIFVMAGPGIARGQTLAGATLLDIAPTILQSFGLPVGEDMDGKVLLPVFSEAQPVQRIASWDAIAGECGQHPPDARLEPGEVEEALRRLADLGYIEEPAADGANALEEATREQRYHLALAYMDARLFHEAAPILHELWERWPEESRFGARWLECHLALRESAHGRATFELLRERRLEAARRAREDLATFREEKKNVPPEKWNRPDFLKARKLQARSNLDPPAMSFYEAQVLAIEGKPNEARKLYEEILVDAAPGRLLELRLRLGEICLLLRDRSAACHHYLGALEIDEENAAAHLGLARVFLFDRRPIHAATHALRAIELNFHEPLAHFFYGVSLIRCGHLDWALGSLQEAVRQAPLFPAAHRRLAGLYARRLHDPAKALHHRAMALQAVESIAARQARVSLLFEKNPASAADWKAPEMRPMRITGKAKGPPSEWITVVTGLPRSGTSMMMQMLVNGGLEPLTDNLRPADASNEKGYFEYAPVKKLAAGDRDWLEQAAGKVVKIVVPLVQYLPPQYPYKIFFMERPLEEILASQESMLERMGKARPAGNASALAKIFALQIARCQRILQNLPQADCLTVSYRHAIEASDLTAQEISQFLGMSHFRIQEAGAAIVPRLYRTRSAKSLGGE
jgi:tetratricopeptide (TPR) repeat protein